MVSAPSWYVLCVGGDRIVGDPATDPSRKMLPSAAPSGPTTRRTMRAHVRRTDLFHLLVFVLALIAMAWYVLHLPRPQH